MDTPEPSKFGDPPEPSKFGDTPEPSKYGDTPKRSKFRDTPERSKFGDTPERSKFGSTPISKFEDSPVFNFINSLSPIQPVKSVHSIHTFHSPGSATVASVFSSPHVSLHKESRFFIRHPFPDSVKHATSSYLLDESNIPSVVSTGAVLPTSNMLTQENSNMICSLNRAIVDPADESSTRPNSSGAVQFESDSPNHNTAPFYGINLDFKLDIHSNQSEQVQFISDVSEGTQNSLSTEISLEAEFSAEKIKKIASESDWKNLISDNDDGLQNLKQPTGLETHKIRKQVNGISLSEQPNTSLDVCLHNDSQDSLVDADGGTIEQQTLKLLPGICSDQEILDEENQKPEAELDDSLSLGCKLDSQHRGVRRRCLVFEVAGVSKMNQLNDPNFTPVILPINAKPSSDNVEQIPSKNLKTSIPYVLPGIGLHLNALARTSKDRSLSQKIMTPGREIVSRPCSVRPYTPAIAGEKQPQNAFDHHQCQNPKGNEGEDNQIVIFDDSFTPALGTEESASPKRKRRKAENSGENESCRRCNCKKSKCLKLYCECFAAGVYCVEPCSCQGCLNKPIHEEIVLATRKLIESRNPLAFAPKVIRTSEHDQETREESNKTPASARHKRGCNCKKSNCLKKYCECYQGGVGCSFSCRCEGCKNAFGRKDGSEEIECEEELDACDKELVKPDDDIVSSKVPKAEQISLSESPLPVTPFGASRSSSVKLSLLSGGKPPRSSTLSTMNRSENQQDDIKIKENDQLFMDADTPESLRVDASPCRAVKTASPNGKRVSLPLNGFGMSPNIKGGRKLILKSIPSFPSLSNEAPSNTQFNSPVLS